MAVKVRRGGKYADRLVNADGYYGRYDAGSLQNFVEKEAGTKREFIGSDVHEYTFYSETKGTLTITAKSFEEALRIANIRGYKRKNYKE